MSYFKFLPKLLYSPTLGVKNFKASTNILAKAKFVADIVENTNLYYPYSVKDGETPEMLSYKFYNDPTKHWIILIANNITDPIYDWVMSMSSFEKYINLKYGSQLFNLNPSESYPTNYTLGEKVYQGATYDRSNCEATVIDSNTTAKTLTVSFSNEVFANSANVTGVISNVTHKIVGITNNKDGYQWASNTTSHYSVTEVRSNSYDKTQTTNKYNVSAKDYNFSSDSVFNRNTNTSYSNSYSLVDGTTFSTKTTVAPVTYYDYELDLNEQKRNIMIIKPTYIPTIEAEFKRLMSS